VATDRAVVPLPIVFDLLDELKTAQRLALVVGDRDTVAQADRPMRGSPPAPHSKLGNGQKSERENSPAAWRLADFARPYPVTPALAAAIPRADPLLHQIQPYGGRIAQHQEPAKGGPKAHNPIIGASSGARGF
jgi:hypothetical protein